MNVKLLLGLGLLAGICAFFFFLLPGEVNTQQGDDIVSVDVEKVTTKKTDSSLIKQSHTGAKLSTPLQYSTQVNQTNNTVSSSSPNDVDKSFPADVARIERESDIVLWSDLTDAKDIEINTVKAKQFDVDPSLLEQFHVGQNIEFETLGGQQTLNSRLTSTSNQLGGVAVWKGQIKNGHPNDNVIITRGKIETHVVVSTTEGTYTTIIDNKTGSATLVDEGEIIAGQLPTEDGIYVEGIDDTPPT